MTETPNTLDVELIDLGRTERKAGRLLTAVKTFERAIERAPDDPAPYLDAGCTLRALGLLQAAKERLTAAVTRWPDAWEIIFELADVTARSGDRAAALDYYLRVIDLQPAFARAYLGAADQTMEANRLAEAHNLLDRGLAVSPPRDPARPLLLQAKATLFALRDQPAESLALLEEALIATGDVKSISRCLVTLANHGKFADAFHILDRLRPVVAMHLTDVPAFEWRFRIIHLAKRFSDMAHERCEFGANCRLLDLKPLRTDREQPLGCVGVAAAPVELASRFYCVGKLLQDGYPKEIPEQVRRLVTEDLKALEHWPQVSQTERAYFLYVLDDCFIFKNREQDGSCVVTERGRFIESLIPQFSPIGLSRVIPLDASRDHESIGEAFVLPDNLGWRNYYHTVVNICSSLSIFDQLGVAASVVVPGQLTAIHREILKAGGIGATTPLLTADELSGVPIRRAYCPTRVGGQLLREWCEEVARRVMGPDDEGRRQGILYISRDQAVTRQLTNEEVLEDELSRMFGARIVHTENLAFETQVRLVRRARLIVAPHGAGLTNILFASPGSWVIELLPDRHPRHGFRDLAAISGHQYVPIIGNVDRLESMEWRIDVDKVTRAAESILSQPELV